MLTLFRIATGDNWSGIMRVSDLSFYSSFFLSNLMSIFKYLKYFLLNKSLFYIPKEIPQQKYSREKVTNLKNWSKKSD